MSDVIIPYRFMCRRGTAANLTAVNEVLRSAEICVETDTGKFKFGDGTTAWNSLPYANAEQEAADVPYDNTTSGLAATDVQVAVDELAAEKLDAPIIHAASSKATPVDADELPLADSAASFGLKKLTLANLWTYISGKIGVIYDTWGIAASDELTALTTGTSKVTFYAPYACTIDEVFIGVSAQSSSGSVTADVNKAGTTIFSTNPSIDASEDTSLTGTAAVLATTTLAKGDKLTIDIDAAGTGAKGLKVFFRVHY